MCGFIGSFGKNPNLYNLSPHLKTLINRGPDFQDFRIIDDYCNMGVARLAMTDPHPRSNQPMWDATNNSVISFNGEIYNFLEIRQKLEKEGHKFKTESDTEVLLTSLNINKSETLKKIKGMYAFAYYELETHKLVLSRDKLGKKPLYYINKNQTIFWSSSIKVLKDIFESNPRSLEEAVDYLSLGYNLDPNTSYNEIFSVMPGHSIEFQLVKDKIKSSDSLNCTFINPHSISIRETLWKAIEDRTNDHTNVALSLSGGVDSTLIGLGLAQQGKKADAYSAFWSDSDKERYNSDRNFAETIATELGHEFHPVDISEGFELEQILREFLAAMEEPNNNPTGLSTLQLYKKIAKDGHRLLLTGDGSDEIFAGYQRHSLSMRYPRILKNSNTTLINLLSRSENKVFRTLKNALLSQLEPKNPLFWLNWHWVFNPREQDSLFENEISTEYVSNTLFQQIESISPVSDMTRAVEILMKRDHEIWLSMESNRKLDRISMHFSLEARSPFQDEDVISAADRIMHGTNYKLLDKKTLKNEFQELKLLKVKKQKDGFISPLGHWMRENPEFIRESLEYLGNLPNWNRSAISNFQNSQFSGDYKTNMQLWTLTVYSTWIRILNGE
jgi:asparagine synthase (glutamine-hydrolysing)